MYSSAGVLEALGPACPSSSVPAWLRGQARAALLLAWEHTQGVLVWRETYQEERAAVEQFKAAELVILSSAMALFRQGGEADAVAASLERLTDAVLRRAAEPKRRTALAHSRSTAAALAQLSGDPAWHALEVPVRDFEENEEDEGDAMGTAAQDHELLLAKSGDAVEPEALVAFGLEPCETVRRAFQDAACLADTEARASRLFRLCASNAGAAGQGEVTRAHRRWAGMGAATAAKAARIMGGLAALAPPPRLEANRPGHEFSPPPVLHVPPEGPQLEQVLRAAGAEGGLSSDRAFEASLRATLAEAGSATPAVLASLGLPLVPGFVVAARKLALEDALVGAWGAMRLRHRALAARPGPEAAPKDQEDWAFAAWTGEGELLPEGARLVSPATGRTWTNEQLEEVCPVSGSAAMIVDPDWVLVGAMLPSTLRTVESGQHRTKAAGEALVKIVAARTSDARSRLLRAMAAGLVKAAGPGAKLGEHWAAIRAELPELVTRICEEDGSGQPKPCRAAAADDCLLPGVLSHVEKRPGQVFDDLARLSQPRLIALASEVAAMAAASRRRAVALLEAHEGVTGYACGVTASEAAGSLGSMPRAPTLEALAGGDWRPELGRQSLGSLSAVQGSAPGSAAPSADNWPFVTRAGHVTAMPLSLVSVVSALATMVASTPLGWVMECHEAADKAADAADEVTASLERMRVSCEHARAETLLSMADGVARRATAEEMMSAAAVRQLSEPLQDREAPMPAVMTRAPLPVSAPAGPLVALPALGRYGTGVGHAKAEGHELLNAKRLVSQSDRLAATPRDDLLKMAELEVQRAVEASDLMFQAKRRAEDIEQQVQAARRAASGAPVKEEGGASAAEEAEEGGESAAAGSDRGASCPISMERIKDAVMCPGCGTLFERACIVAWFGNSKTCPTCKRGLDLDDLLEPRARKLQSGRELEAVRLGQVQSPELSLARSAASVLAEPRLRSEPLPETAVLNETAVEGEADGMGAKLRVVVARLKLLPPDEAALVFSQERLVMLALSAALKASGVPSGALTSKRSAALVKRFQGYGATSGKPRPRVLLLDFRHNASGLTLTAASHVFLMEPYTPEDERQAIGRALRLGQQRKVVCYRVTMAGTLEERILAVREAEHGGEAPASVLRDKPASRLDIVASQASSVAAGRVAEEYKLADEMVAAGCRALALQRRTDVAAAAWDAEPEDGGTEAWASGAAAGTPAARASPTAAASPTRRSSPGRSGRSRSRKRSSRKRGRDDGKEALLTSVRSVADGGVDLSEVFAE